MMIWVRLKRQMQPFDLYYAQCNSLDIGIPDADDRVWLSNLLFGDGAAYHCIHHSHVRVRIDTGFYGDV